MLAYSQANNIRLLNVANDFVTETQAIGGSRASTLRMVQTGGILLAFLALFNPGDQVLVPDPYFVMYKPLLHLIGARPASVDTYPYFRLRRADLEMLSNAQIDARLGFSPIHVTAGGDAAPASGDIEKRVARRADFVERGEHAAQR